MRKELLFISLLFIAFSSLGQSNLSYSLTSIASVRRPKEYLAMSNNNSQWSEQSKVVKLEYSDGQKNYQSKRQLFLALTVPLLTASFISNQANNKDLAIGFDIGGVVTSSLALYYMIKEDKQKKKN